MQTVFSVPPGSGTGLLIHHIRPSHKSQPGLPGPDYTVTHSTTSWTEINAPQRPQRPKTPVTHADFWRPAPKYTDTPLQQFNVGTQRFKHQASWPHSSACCFAHALLLDSDSQQCHQGRPPVVVNNHPELAAVEMGGGNAGVATVVDMGMVIGGEGGGGGCGEEH
jgi:hypothetical protein